MKTKNDIKKLNFNDYAFFKGVSTTDAKWKFAEFLFPTEEIEENLTKSGTPKIGINDYLPVDNFDFKMRSNSKLDGLSQFEYLCDYYNSGIPLNTLREFSENTTYIKALKFTGKNNIINEILNTEQLLKLQKTWILKTFQTINFDNLIKFEMSNDWVINFLYESKVDIDKYEKMKFRYLNPNEEYASGYSFQN